MSLTTSPECKVSIFSHLYIYKIGFITYETVVGQGPTALAVGAGWSCLDIFSLIYHFSFLYPSLWEAARYRLKYWLKGPLSPKQPTNQPTYETESVLFKAQLENYVFPMGWHSSHANQVAGARVGRPQTSSGPK